MSDMYVELKSKIPVVAARTAVGRERLQAAQDAIGLSNERVARLIPVSTKTWERWKKAGEIPTQWLPQVARALHFEIVEAPATLELYEGSGQGGPPLQLLRDAAEQILEGQQEILACQQEILARIARLEETRDERPARPRARRAR